MSYGLPQFPSTVTNLYMKTPRQEWVLITRDANSADKGGKGGYSAWSRSRQFFEKDARISLASGVGARSNVFRTRAAVDATIIHSEPGAWPSRRTQGSFGP